MVGEGSGFVAIRNSIDATLLSRREQRNTEKWRWSYELACFDSHAGVSKMIEWEIAVFKLWKEAGVSLNAVLGVDKDSMR